MKKLIGLMMATMIASIILGAMALPAMAQTNAGGVVVESGDAPDCVGGSCGGVIVEDPVGIGPDCTGGNCGGSVCAGPNCGTCADGNCGGSISGSGEKPGTAPSSLPRTGNTLPLAATVALGAGMLLVGAFFTFAAHPSTKLAMAALAYRPKRRL
ncbi:MAG: hypothetical protein ACT4OM_10060 [Actinomycetota bacterium]